MSILRPLVEPYAHSLMVPLGIQPVPLLLAIADVESSGGTNNVPKHEPAYDYGGLYWKKATHVKLAVKKYGAFAACSYSSWQIMFILAQEMGYDDDPAGLRSDKVALPWVCAALNKRIFARGAQNLRDIADGWNSGSFTDAHVPHEYVEKLRLAYESHTRA